jgi:alkanesulfonate monooxygenase SsuD/methylene tetrahydromethanopterin reductase-like flavin-dependent oxidoreductase (luciferase family)
VRVDVLLETFGSRWPEIRDGALAAQRTGFDGVWLNDHLVGSVEGAPHVLECWTILSALAVEVPRITVGPLVLNVANRDPGILAVMAATLQHVSGGRLLLGLGAGARRGTSYATEQETLGRPVLTDPERRRAVERTIGVLRQVWSGAVARTAGFLQPEPVPPILVAGSGPKMAELAGRVGDGICLPVGPMMPELVEIARRAYARSGRDPERLIVTASLATLPERKESPLRLGVDRLVLYVTPPFDAGVARLGEITHEWREDVLRRE